MAVPDKSDWRSGCDDIASLSDKARNESRFTDVIFMLGEAGKPEKIFHAHKLILAFGSPVFEAMFFGPLAQNKSVVKTDDDPEAFEMLLNYMYRKSYKMSSLNSALKFLAIGDKYLVPKIQDIVKKYIGQLFLTEDSFWKVIQCNILKDPISIPNVLHYVTEQAGDLITSPLIMNAPENFVLRFLQIEHKDVSQYQLLLFATKWAYNNLKEPDSEKLTKFYKNIKFSKLTMEKFFEFIESYPKAIDVESKFKILQHINDPYHHKMPEWFTESKE